MTRQQDIERAASEMVQWAYLTRERVSVNRAVTAADCAVLESFAPVTHAEGEAARAAARRAAQRIVARRGSVPVFDSPKFRYIFANANVTRIAVAHAFAACEYHPIVLGRPCVTATVFTDLDSDVGAHVTPDDKTADTRAPRVLVMFRLRVRWFFDVYRHGLAVTPDRRFVLNVRKGERLVLNGLFAPVARWERV